MSAQLVKMLEARDESGSDRPFYLDPEIVETVSSEGGTTKIETASDIIHVRGTLDEVVAIVNEARERPNLTISFRLMKLSEAVDELRKQVALPRSFGR